MIGRATKGYGDYGFTVGCSEFDTALNQLNIALGIAQGTTGVDQTDPNYLSALNFYNQQTGLVSGDWFALGSTCTSLVSQAKQAITALNALITAASTANGVPPPTLVDPTQIPTPPPGLFPSIPSWVLPVGLGVVGLGLAGWIFSSATKLFPRRSKQPA